MNAAILLLCDNRAPLDGLELSPNSVVALPAKRQALRDFAAANDVTLEGEILIELSPGDNLNSIIDSACQKAQQLGARDVLSLDLAPLADVGLLSVLDNRLRVLGKALRPVPQ